MQQVTHPVLIKSAWFARGFDHATSQPRILPTDEALVEIARNAIRIALEDLEISEEQLDYEVGYFVGALLTAIGL